MWRWRGTAAGEEAIAPTIEDAVIDGSVAAAIITTRVLVVVRSTSSFATKSSRHRSGG
jgi:hypothetical protein